MMRPFRSQRGRSRSWHCGMLVAGAVALALTAAACTSSGAQSSSGNTPVNGGTAVFALAPSTAANYIFPYISANNQSIANMQDLQFLMYRPLYWFGKGSQPTLNNSLSLAYPPTFNGNTVTIRLKHYMWSNGTPVTAQNVMFWLNMEQDVPADYGLYTGFPGKVVHDMKAVSSTELTMTMDQAYSPTWFLYNELSQVTPMPTAWDRTASGPSSCSTTAGDCASVYAYLNDQAKDFSTYVTSPLWSVVDGPWKLSAFNADGHLTFVPNKSYSGPVKPKLAEFKEVPFITAASEYDVLESPSSSTKVDVGYVPQEDVPAKPANAAVGGNPLSSKGYTMSPWPLWGIAYYTMNMQSTTGNGPIMKQLYFRQAMAYLLNQQAVIDGPLRGYGTVTVGPVGNTPPSEFLSPQGKQGDPFPYSPAKAKQLLSSHGWKIVPNGASTCTDPSLCGPGIPKGKGLNFNFIYATGTAWVASEMQDLQSNAAAVGIKLNLQPKVPTDVTEVAGGNCVSAHLPCNWDMANYGGAWTFFPDYLPTGEDLFICGAIPNSSGFCDKQDDSLINKTLTSSNLSYMFQWQNYLAPLLPQMWQPLADYQLTEVASNLRGVTPQMPTLDILPENWYFVK
jgi:peptide/nickel transport system substrate-binding protein